MAGIPWGKYERSDWVRVPGASRRYRSVQNPDITISRRQFDEHYGSAASFGTYEKKAAKNAGSAKQLLRPARGRSSALNLSDTEQQAEINRRKTAQAETKHDKLVARLQTKKDRVPSSISLRNFGNRKAIRKFRVPVSVEAVEQIRNAGAKSRIVFGYWVGLEIVSERDNRVLTPTLFPQRDIREPFTQEDLLKALQMANVKNYATLTGMWVALHLTNAAAIRNGVKVKKYA